MSSIYVSDIIHFSFQQQKFAAKARDAIETLKQRLAQAETKANSADADGLRAEVDSLVQTISEKDERIKKLEKSKITKSQIQNIQKLKVRASACNSLCELFKHILTRGVGRTKPIHARGERI